MWTIWIREFRYVYDVVIFHSIFSQSSSMRNFQVLFRDATEPVWDLEWLWDGHLWWNLKWMFLGLWLPVWSTPRWCHVVSRRARADNGKSEWPTFSCLWKYCWHLKTPVDTLIYWCLCHWEGLKNMLRCMISAEIFAFSKDPRWIHLKSWRNLGISPSIFKSDPRMTEVIGE